MKEELIAGIQNAIERGNTIENAIESLINAGYNPQEVRDAAQSFTSGASSMLNYSPDKGKSFPVVISGNGNGSQQLNNPQEAYAVKEAPQKPAPQPVKAPQPVQQVPDQRPPVQMYSPKTVDQNPKRKMLVIFLIIWLILLGAVLAAIWFFKDQLLSLLS